MHRPIDLTGRRVGRLVCVEQTDKRAKNGAVLWKCQCDCGNIHFVAGSDLRRKTTQSCGCLKKEMWLKKGMQLGCPDITVDLTGQRYGRLICLEKTDKRSNGGIIWKCRCDCGNICDVLAKSMRGGHTKSCGCLKKEMDDKRRICFTEDERKKRKAYTNRRWNKENKEVIKFNRKKDTGNVPTWYVIQRLRGQGIFNILPDMIAVKREQLKVTRLLREMTK